MLILDIAFALSVYYSASALLAMPTAVIARGYTVSVCPSVCQLCLSFRHIPVFCPDELRYDRAVFSIR